jgi:hypothetical protein
MLKKNPEGALLFSFLWYNWIDNWCVWLFANALSMGFLPGTS